MNRFRGEPRIWKDIFEQGDSSWSTYALAGLVGITIFGFIALIARFVLWNVETAPIIN